MVVIHFERSRQPLVAWWRHVSGYVGVRVAAPRLSVVDEADCQCPGVSVCLGFVRSNYVCTSRHLCPLTDRRYVADLGLLLSASLDATIAMYDVGRREVVRRFYGHERAGVRAFEWCRAGKCSLLAHGHRTRSACDRPAVTPPRGEEKTPTRKPPRADLVRLINRQAHGLVRRRAHAARVEPVHGRRDRAARRPRHADRRRRSRRGERATHLRRRDQERASATRAPPSAVRRPPSRARRRRPRRTWCFSSCRETRVPRRSPHNNDVCGAVIVVRPPLDRRQVRCWDAFTLRCTQTFVDATPYRPVNGVSSLLWDTARGALLTAGHRLTVWPMRARLAPRAKANRSHRAAVCAALYNPHFGQVVSGDALASVHVWSVETGEASNGVAYQDQVSQQLSRE